MSETSSKDYDHLVALTTSDCNGVHLERQASFTGFSPKSHAPVRSLGRSLPVVTQHFESGATRVDCPFASLAQDGRTMCHALLSRTTESGQEKQYDAQTLTPQIERHRIEVRGRGGLTIQPSSDRLKLVECPRVHGPMVAPEPTKTKE